MLPSSFLSLALFFSTSLAIPTFAHNAVAPLNDTSAPAATAAWERRQLYPTGAAAQWEKRQPYPTAPTYEKRQLYPTAASWEKRQLQPTGTTPEHKRQALPSGAVHPADSTLAQRELDAARNATTPRFQGARQNRKHYYAVAGPAETPAAAAPTGVVERAAAAAATGAQVRGNAEPSAGPIGARCVPGVAAGSVARRVVGPTGVAARFARATGVAAAYPTGVY